MSDSTNDPTIPAPADAVAATNTPQPISPPIYSPAPGTDGAVHQPIDSMGAKIARRSAAIILLIAAVVALTVGVSLRCLGTVAGNSKNAADTLIAVTSTNQVSRAIATAAVKDLAGYENPAVNQIMLSQPTKDRLVNALAIKIQSDREIHSLVRSYVTQAYADFNSGNGGTLDFRPLVSYITAVLHQADSRVSAAPPAVNGNYTWTMNPMAHHVNVESAIKDMTWAALIIGALLAIIASRFLIRNRTRRIVALALAFFLPAIFFIPTGLELARSKNTLSINDPTAQVIGNQALQRIGRAIEDGGFMIAIAGAVVVAFWLVARSINDRRRATAVAAS